VKIDVTVKMTMKMTGITTLHCVRTILDAEYPNNDEIETYLQWKTNRNLNVICPVT